MGTPKDTPESPLCPTSTWSIGSEDSKLGAREGTLGPTEVVGTPKLPPTSGEDPKRYTLISITPYLTPSWPSLALWASWGLRKTWEPLEAFYSLGSLVRLRDLASHSPLAPPCPLTPWASLDPWAFLGPWDLPGASGSLGSLWKPSEALVLQSDSGTLLPTSPLPPCSLDSWDLPGASGSLGSLLQPWVFSQTEGPCSPCSPHPHLAPPCPLSLPGPLGPSWSLRKPWEPLEAFGSLEYSVRLRDLAPLTPPHP